MGDKGTSAAVVCCIFVSGKWDHQLLGQELPKIFAYGPDGNLIISGHQYMTGGCLVLSCWACRPVSQGVRDSVHVVEVAR